jgi:hypothetical protein
LTALVDVGFEHDPTDEWVSSLQLGSDTEGDFVLISVIFLG